MTLALTEEQFKAALPAHMTKSVNPLLMMRINNTLSSPEEWENYKDNLLDYVGVLQQGKFKMQNYLDAVRYVGFKVMGFNNITSYRKTFPDKYAKFVREGVSSKAIASYSTAYNQSKLVNLIYEQTLIPAYLLNAPQFQKAINKQVSIMNNEKASFKVQSDAANSLLTHLKPPETKKVELDIGINTTSIIDDYEQAMSTMVAKQLELMKAGGDVKQIANAKIPTTEVIDV
jgi:hypothetical protein